MNRRVFRHMAPLARPAAAGLVLALSSPPFNFYPGVWLGMIALAVVLDDGRAPPTARRARFFAGGARGLAFGFGANLVAFRFVPEVITRFTPLPWAAGALALVLLSAAQGLRWFFAALVHKHLARRGVPPWAAFAFGVYAGTFFPMVFPWNPAGGVSPWTAMVQLADVVGERGVTAIMALTAGLAAAAIARLREGDRRGVASFAGLAAALPIATWAWGASRMNAIETERAAAPTVRIGLVEPSIGATDRWDRAQSVRILRGLTDLTRKAESEGAELTVWPEASYPYVVGHRARRAPIGAMAILGPGVHGPVLAGMVTSDEDGSYNSAVVVSPGGQLGAPYDKMHLLWFGETVPLADQFAWIRRTFARGVGLSPGSAQVLLTAGPVRAAVLNCFEDILPGAGREAIGVAPNLFVNVTNDAWFAGSAESELHLRMATMRAVEERRDFVRAVNFGPTSWVDAAGIVRGRYDPKEPGVLIATPALLTRPVTIFGRFGDAPWAFLLTIAGAAGVLRARARSRRDSRHLASNPSETPATPEKPAEAPSGAS